MHMMMLYIDVFVKKKEAKNARHKARPLFSVALNALFGGMFIRSVLLSNPTFLIHLSEGSFPHSAFIFNGSFCYQVKM